MKYYLPICFIVCFGLIEIGARLLINPKHQEAPFARTNAPDPYSIFATEPNLNHTSDQAPLGKRLHYITTDKYGFRTKHNLSATKQTGERRIFLLGGSVVFNGLTNETTICGYLEKLLNKPNATLYKCVNAGIVSAVSDQELATLVHKVLDLEPDLVVSFSGFNDVNSRMRYDPRLGYPFNWFTIEDLILSQQEYSDQFKNYPLWKHALAKSRFVTTLFPNLSYSQQLTRQLSTQAGEQYKRVSQKLVAEHLLKNWRKMKSIAAAQSVNMIGVLQPMKEDARDRFPEYREFYQLLNKMIADANKQGLPFHTFDGMFKDQDELFWDIIHTFDRGNEMIAKKLLPLIQNGLSVAAH